MEKSIIVKLIVCFIVMNALGIAGAMPMHPDVLKKYRSIHKSVKSAEQINSGIQRGVDRPKKTFPSTGNRKVLVILIGYPDTSLDVISTPAFYSDIFNGGSSKTLTLKKYYQDMSNEQLSLDFVIAGPYTSSDNLNYYGANDPSGYDRYPGALAGEALDAAESDGVDFTQFDNDNDGIVDVVIVIHAGQGEEAGASANTIWSHSWDLDSANAFGDGSGHRTYDGKIINEYTMQPEFVMTPGDTAVGVFAHEFGHVLGLPDLYDITYATDGAGNWSLMASGAWNGPYKLGEVPAPLLSWEKMRLGWAAVNDISLNRNAQWGEITGFTFFIILSFMLIIYINLLHKLESLYSKKYRSAIVNVFALLFFFIIMNCTHSDPSKPGHDNSNIISLNDTDLAGSSVKINLGDPYNEQYYLIENKFKKIGTWSEFLPGDGLLICHIDEFIINWKINSNEVNSSIVHGLNIIEADGDNNLWSAYDPDQGSETDIFYQGNSSSITPDSDPDTNYNEYLNNHTSVIPYGGISGISITGISDFGSTMNFSFSVNQ